jgi:chorismate synthase
MSDALEVRLRGGLTIRPFDALHEYEACVAFQEEIWGKGFSEKIPTAMLIIANRLGGLSAGAFNEEGELHGFVFGITGLVDGELVHWSDMLAVRDQGRDVGLGTELKAYQRAVLLGRGVRKMRWTFDPLQGRNAHVNFTKLGCVSGEYVENMYGDTESPLHGGVGTDRLVATWLMASPRVQDRLGGRCEIPKLENWPEAVGVLKVDDDGPFPTPGAIDLESEAVNLLVPVPFAIDEIMAKEMELAGKWREATRAVFAHYLAQGYEVREFIRGERVSSYLLEGPDQGSQSLSGKTAS